MTDGQTNGRTDRRTGKNNMSSDPVGGRNNNKHNKWLIVFFLQIAQFQIQNQVLKVETFKFFCI